MIRETRRIVACLCVAALLPVASASAGPAEEFCVLARESAAVPWVTPAPPAKAVDLREFLRSPGPDRTGHGTPTPALSFLNAQTSGGGGSSGMSAAKKTWIIVGIVVGAAVVVTLVKNSGDDNNNGGGGGY